MSDHSPTVPPDQVVILDPEPACLVQALAYLDRGWCPVPLCPPDHSGPLPPGHCDRCTRPGKRPPYKWQHLHLRPPTAEELLDHWRRNHSLNVGIVLGQVSGLVGVDIDGPEGEEELRRMCSGELPAGLEFTTPGGGRRLLFAWPRDLPTVTTSFPTSKKPLHFLGNGSLTVAPPSRHVLPGEYAWKYPEMFQERNIPDPPECIRAVFLGQTTRRRRPGGGVSSAPAAGADLGLVARARAYLAKCDPAVSGKGGHNQTFKVACRLVRGFKLSSDIALSLLLEAWNPRCLPPWSEGELRHKIEDAVKGGESPDLAGAPDQAAPGNPPASPRRAGRHPRSSSPSGVGPESSPQDSDDDGPAADLPGLVSAAELPDVPVDLAWKDRLAFGTLAVVEGKKGVGKGQFLAKLAADLTGGPRLPSPGARPRVVGPVLWLSGEDDVARVTRPRLVAAEADVGKVLFPTRPGDPSNRWAPLLPGDLGQLGRLVRREGARAVFLDPYLPFVAAGVNNNVEQTIRQVLDPLNQLAQETGALVVLTRNLSKVRGGEALDQGLGSVAVGNVARSILRLSRHPERADRHVLAVVSCNLGELPPALLYHLEDVQGVPRLAFDGTADLTADQLAEGPLSPGQREALEDAKRLLRKVLSGGCMKAKDVLKLAEEERIGERIMREAKAALRCPSRQHKGKDEHYHLWCPPEEGFPPAV